MFKAERIFYQTNAKTGLRDWYFAAREGEIGPFATRERALAAIDEYIKFNIENENDGDRGSNFELENHNAMSKSIGFFTTIHLPKNATLSLIPLDSCLYWLKSKNQLRYNEYQDN
jgi:hypothetical protein